MHQALFTKTIGPSVLAISFSQGVGKSSSYISLLKKGLLSFSSSTHAQYAKKPVMPPVPPIINSSFVPPFSPIHDTSSDPHLRPPTPLNQTSSSKSSSSSFLKYILCLIPVITFGLGTWQYQRRSWKRELLSTIRSKYELPAIENIASIDTHEATYRRMKIEGKPVMKDGRPLLIHVGPRVNHGKQGYHLFMPIRTKSSIVWVFLGWVPTKDTQLPMSKTITVEGIIRSDEQRNYFTPPNQPDRQQWFTFSLPQVNDMYQLSTPPFYIEQLDHTTSATPSPLDSKKQTLPGIFCRTPKEALTLRDQHTQYMVTWYTMSLFTSLMLYYRLKK